MSMVRFFPKASVPAKICNFRYGADCAISLLTDRLVASKYAIAELMLFKHNFQGTAFLSKYSESTSQTIADAVGGAGRVGFGAYYWTDRWYNPVTHVIETIPDYYATAWTAAGVAAFSGASLGVAKAAQCPNHGQQLFDISGGSYGYDIANSVSGASDGIEYKNVIADIVAYTEALMHKKLTAISYENGRDAMSPLLIPYFLGGRNSEILYSGDRYTAYGTSKYADTPGDELGLPAGSTVNRATVITRKSTSRAVDMFIQGVFPTIDAAIANSVAELTKTLSSHGWFTDFVHWNDHYDQPATFLKSYFDTHWGALETAVGSTLVWNCTYLEAIEYLMLRNCIRRAAAYEKSGKIVLTLDVRDIYAGTITNGIANDLTLSKLTTPIAIEIDLSGTSLAGKNIKVSDSREVRSLGSDKYILDLQCQLSADGYTKYIIEEATQANYQSFIKPTILSYSYSDGYVSIVTDQPTNCVIFVAVRGADITTVQDSGRSNAMRFDHKIAVTVNEATSDIYVGIVNNVGQSNLLGPYAFA